MSAACKARVALSTGSLYTWSLDRVFALAALAGFDGVELLVDARMESYDQPYLADLSERHQLPILSVHTPFVKRVEGWSNAPEERVVQALELAEALGAETVVAHLPQRPALGHIEIGFGGWRGRYDFRLPWHDRRGARYRRWLCDRLPAFQTQTPVRIAVENMSARCVLGQRVSCHHFSRVEELERFPYLVLDTTHWGTFGKDPTEVYRALRERIIHVHLANYDGREHRLPFKGNLDLERLLHALAVCAFGGLIVVEADPWAVAEGDWSPGHISEVLSKTVTEVRSHLGGQPFA